MLTYNQIIIKKYIIYEGSPYEVLSSRVFRKQQRKPVNQTKLKNLKTGKIIEVSFHQSEKVEEANIETKKIKYLYRKLAPNRAEGKGKFYFCEENDPKKRFNLPEEIIGNEIKFIKENSLIDALLFSNEIIGLKIPIKVELKVIDAPPNIKGNTSSGGNKPVILETGAIVNTPFFINQGEKIIINTETGEYVGRVEK